MYSTEEIMHRQTLVNKRNMSRRGLTATESCAEHLGTFNRRRVAIEVEGKIHNVRTHENVRGIFFKYIFIFPVQINRKNSGRILWFIPSREYSISTQSHVKWSWRHCNILPLGRALQFNELNLAWQVSRTNLLQTLCYTNQIKKYTLTQGDM